jgi:hypothetical protein
LNEEVDFGKITRIPLGEREKAKVNINPTRHFDIGEGGGRRLETEVEGGVVGVVIDARGRPLSLPEDEESRKAKLFEWFRALNLYPEEILKG